jgi:hypothetical protein
LVDVYEFLFRLKFLAIPDGIGEVKRDFWIELGEQFNQASVRFIDFLSGHAFQFECGLHGFKRGTGGAIESHPERYRNAERRYRDVFPLFELVDLFEQFDPKFISGLDDSFFEFIEIPFFRQFERVKYSVRALQKQCCQQNDYGET